MKNLCRKCKKCHKAIFFFSHNKNSLSIIFKIEDKNKKAIATGAYNTDSFEISATRLTTATYCFKTNKLYVSKEGILVTSDFLKELIKEKCEFSFEMEILEDEY